MCNYTIIVPTETPVALVRYGSAKVTRTVEDVLLQVSTTSVDSTSISLQKNRILYCNCNIIILKAILATDTTQFLFLESYTGYNKLQYTVYINN